MSVAREILTNPDMLRVVLPGTAQALGLLVATTVYNHRELTHQSIETKGPARKVCRFMMRCIGQDPDTWSDIHGETGHHKNADSNFVPIIERADFYDWLYDPEQKTIRQQLELQDRLPEYYDNLDPSARLREKDVRKIGALARRAVEGRYTRPDDYDDETIIRMLDTETLFYQYPDRPGWLRRLLTGQKKAEEQEPEPGTLAALTPELRDGHAPALHPKGIRGILFGANNNKDLYKRDAEYYDKKAGRERNKWGVKLWIGANIAGQALTMIRNPGLSEAIKAVGYGTSAALFAGYALDWGGRLTNALGHGGRRLWRSLFRNKPEVKPDGTYSSNSLLAAPPSLDEAGGQEPHHGTFIAQEEEQVEDVDTDVLAYNRQNAHDSGSSEDKVVYIKGGPWKIAYTDETGWKKRIHAPFGTGLEFLARHNILVRLGKQFGNPEIVNTEQGDVISIRPDMPSLAVLALEKRRRETLKEKELEKQAQKDLPIAA